VAVRTVNRFNRNVFYRVSTIAPTTPATDKLNIVKRTKIRSNYLRKRQQCCSNDSKESLDSCWCWPVTCFAV